MLAVNARSNACVEDRGFAISAGKPHGGAEIFTRSAEQIESESHRRKEGAEASQKGSIESRKRAIATGLSEAREGEKRFSKKCVRGLSKGSERRSLARSNCLLPALPRLRRG